jgi:hypothetical protein
MSLMFHTSPYTTLTTDIHAPGGIFFFASPGFSPFDPFLYCLNTFVLHVTLRSILPSLQQTQHKHPCPRRDFFFSVPSFPFDPFCTFKSFRPSSCHLCSILVLIQHSQQTDIYAPGGIFSSSSCPGFFPFFIHFCTVLNPFFVLHVTYVPY